LHQLNLEYRGIDTPTDVLAFSAREDLREPGVVFVVAPEAEAYLGDVIISYPRATRQAEVAGHSVANELCLLAVHGVLHLLGYDHATAEEESAMWAVQDAVLAGLPREL
jgi:probable rRNA maturation factor